MNFTVVIFESIAAWNVGNYHMVLAGLEPARTVWMDNKVIAIFTDKVELSGEIGGQTKIVSCAGFGLLSVEPAELDKFLSSPTSYSVIKTGAEEWHMWAAYAGPKRPGETARTLKSRKTLAEAMAVCLNDHGDSLVWAQVSQDRWDATAESTAAGP